MMTRRFMSRKWLSESGESAGQRASSPRSSAGRQCPREEDDANEADSTRRPCRKRRPFRALMHLESFVILFTTLGRRQPGEVADAFGEPGSQGRGTITTSASEVLRPA